MGTSRAGVLTVEEFGDGAAIGESFGAGGSSETDGLVWRLVRSFS